jgi:hypothetical protein
MQRLRCDDEKQSYPVVFICISRYDIPRLGYDIAALPKSQVIGLGMLEIKIAGRILSDVMIYERETRRSVIGQ